MTDEPVTLFHAPRTRSSATLTLLEELGAPYELRVLDLKAGEQRQAAHLAVNPLGKVPAIRHRGIVVTEQVAIFIYLADEFATAGLAPAIGDLGRGPYLRWLVMYAACYEPGMMDAAMKRDPGPLSSSPYGSFDAVVRTVCSELEHGPYLLGDVPSAADILWGTALRWGVMFNLVPENATIRDYAARIAQRPAALKVAAVDADLAAAQEAATAG